MVFKEVRSIPLNIEMVIYLFNRKNMCNVQSVKKWRKCQNGSWFAFYRGTSTTTWDCITAMTQSLFVYKFILLKP